MTAPAIRSMEPEDFAQVGVCARELSAIKVYSGEEWSPEAAADIIAKETSVCLVAAEKRKVTGFLIADVNEELSSAKIMWCAFVWERTGELLVSELMSRLHRAQINELTVPLSSTNEQGIAFYKKVGIANIKETILIFSREGIQ